MYRRETLCFEKHCTSPVANFFHVSLLLQGTLSEFEYFFQIRVVGILSTNYAVEKWSSFFFEQNNSHFSSEKVFFFMIFITFVQYLQGEFNVMIRCVLLTKA